MTAGATASGTTTPAPAGRSAPRGAVGPRAARLLVLAGLLLAVGPFLVVVGSLLLRDLPATLSGDQALAGLATREALAGDRLLGAYSRYGWNHPGPAWFYAMAAPYAVLAAVTSPAAALVGATSLVHSVVAAALVTVAGGGRPLRVAAAGLAVAAFVAGVPDGVMVEVWNPFALVLPLALLVLLAGRVVGAGSPPALTGSALVGGYLVQTHVGTAPVVAAVALLLGGVLVAGAVRRSRGGGPAALRPPGPRGRLAAGALGGAALLLWVPPLLQQLGPGGGPGNLAAVVAYFTGGDAAAGTPRGAAEVGTGEGQPPGAALAVVGRLLALPARGGAYVLEAVPVAVTPGALAVVAAVVAAAGALLAARRRAAADGWTGGVALVVLGAAVLAVTRVEAPVYNYLVIWVPGITLAVGLALAGVVADTAADRVRGLPGARAPRGRPARPTSRGAGVALAVVLAAVAVAGLVGARLAPTPGQVGGFDGVAMAEAVDRVAPALDDGPGHDVVLALDGDAPWQYGAAAAFALREQWGLDAAVEPDLVVLFGRARVADPAARAGLPRLVVAAVEPGEPPPAGAATASTSTGPVAVRVEPVPGGTS